MAAAEGLFADRGIETVSLREINTAAGATNSSAIQYYFGDRAGLIWAVLDKHRPAVESRRHALLDQYEADAREDLRALAGAFVRPLAAQLDNADGGPGYLQLLADLVNRPWVVLDPAIGQDPHDSTRRWRQLVKPLLDPVAVENHRRFVGIRFTYTELARRARDPEKDHRAFVSQLVDLLTSILSAPVSAETRRHLAPPEP